MEAEEPQRKQLDLSVPQVAGSALAAVAAAVLASKLGVYGTVIGAGVVSVVATCGGTVFQFLFKRTGEQLRDVTVQVKPKGRQVPVRQVPGGTDPGAVPPTVAVPRPEDVRTRPVRERSGRAAPDATRALPVVGGPQHATRASWPVPAAGAPRSHGKPADDFTDATTYGHRVRGWKRSALAAVVVFVLAMAGITAYELISGQEIGGGKGTTVGNSFKGDHEGKTGVPSQSPSEPSGERSPEGTAPDDGSSGGDPALPVPSADPGQDVPSTAPSPGPTASGDDSTPGTDPSASPGDPSPDGGTEDDVGGDTDGTGGPGAGASDGDDGSADVPGAPQPGAGTPKP